MKPTLRDIAEATSLSVASVSLVLNGRPNKLSADSRKRITEAARTLGYVPIQRSRPEAARPERVLGLIVPSLTNFFFAEIVQGVEACAQENGWQLLLATNADMPEKDRENLQLFTSHGVSGLVIASAANCDNSMFAAIPFPVVQVDRQSPTLDCSAVVLNHRKGGYLATRHLLELGHTRIACITGPQKHESARQRMEGYLWAMEDAGVPLPRDGVFECNYCSDGGYGAADPILERGFTAVFSGNDMMALGLYKRLRELGKHIPGDLSIVGFDDIECADLLDVPLTTIHQSGFDLGHAACQRVITEIASPGISKQTIHFEPRLVVRRSTAALAGHQKK